MLGKSCDRVVVAGLVMSFNCSWNVSVYSRLGKVTYGRAFRDRSVFVNKCVNLLVVIVTRGG